MKKDKILLLISIGLLLLISTSTSLPLVSAETDDEMPKYWYGKRKVIDNFGKYTRVALIHYEAGVTDVGNPDGDGSSDGYEILGVWWDLNKYPGGVPYIINPSTAVKSYGLSASFVVNEVKSALESWDLAVDLSDYEVDYVAYPDFVDVGGETTIHYTINLYNDNPTINNKAKASTGYPDYKNVITWGRAQAGVVAYAVIWYVSSTGEIVDADIVLNSYYKWGITDGNEATTDFTNKFDIRNIVTHESGHWSGLDDIYDSAYSAMTMYGYTKYGEEIKRSLEPGDVAGVQCVYASLRA
jgi:hypothetical protein